MTKLRASDGANLGTFAVGDCPTGVAFDGVNIWVANAGSSDVTRLRAKDGKSLGNLSRWGTIPEAWPSTAPISG